VVVGWSGGGRGCVQVCPSVRNRAGGVAGWSGEQRQAEPAGAGRSGWARQAEPAGCGLSYRPRAEQVAVVGLVPSGGSLAAGRSRRLPVGEQVAEQDDVVELADFGGLHAAVWAVGVAAGAGEAWCGRVADEERRDRQVQLVGQPRGEELGREAAAALEQETGDSSFGKILEDFRERRRAT